MGFEQWYRRALAGAPGAAVAAQGGTGSGNADGYCAAVFWPQLHCPPSLLHEHAFLELMRMFTECSESEAFDLFDILDADCLGMLGLQQVYMAMCLIAAVGSQQLTKFLHFHSTHFFFVLAKGCRLTAAPERVFWPHLVTFLRLIGAPGHLISKVSTANDITPLAQLSYEDFLY